MFKKSLISLSVVAALGCAAGFVQAANLAAEGNTWTDADFKNKGGDRALGLWHIDTAAKADSLVDGKDADISISTRVWDSIVGGSYLKTTGDTKRTFTMGNSTVLIEGADTEIMEFVVGGMMADGSQNGDKAITLEGKSTEVTLRGGTYGTVADGNVLVKMVVAGNLVKANDPHKKVVMTSSLESASLNIAGGTFNSVILGGSVAYGYYETSKNLTSTVDKTKVVITGGTFNDPIVAGGSAGGHNAHSTVTQADLSIDGSSGLVINDNIYAGSLLISNGSANQTAVVEDATLKIENATVKNIYDGDVKATWDSTNSKWLFSDAPTKDLDRVTNITLTNAKADSLVLNGAAKVDLKDANVSVISFNPIQSDKDLSLDNPGNTTIGTQSNKNLTVDIQGNTTIGTFNQIGGKVTLTGTNFAGKMNVSNAATLDISGLTSANLANTTLTDSTLKALSAQVFKNGLGNGSVTAPEALLYSNLFYGTQNALIVTDQYINVDYLNAASTLMGNKGTITFTGTLGGTGSVGLGQLENVGENVVVDQVTVEVGKNSTTTTLQIGGTNADANTEHREESLHVGAVDLGNAATVVVTGGKELSLIGATNDGVIKTEAETVTVKVQENAALNLGGTNTQGASLENVVVMLDEANLTIKGDATAEDKKKFSLPEVYAEKGSIVNVAQKADAQIAEVTLTTNAKLVVSDNANAAIGNLSLLGENAVVELADAQALISKLTGEGTINVGNKDSAGHLTANVDGFTGLIFADPAWIDGVGIEGASKVALEQTSGDLTAKVVAGQNSIVAIGASTEEATQAFKSIAEQGLTWSETGVTAAVYIGQTIKPSADGGVLVNGTLTNSTEASNQFASAATGKVFIGKNGMMIVDQNISGPAVNGTVTFDSGSYLGIANATEGAVLVAPVVIGTANVVTDNPFYEGKLSGTTVQTSYSAQGGLITLAAAGMQQTMRRADTMLATSIADRTAFDQEMNSGTNLWVDASAERYDTDGAIEGAGFKSDMGYGAFGADVALTDDVTAGMAIQYGKGSLRGDQSIKNDIDNYGVALYGSWKLGNAKLVGDVAYLEGKNEISAAQTALNQDVDTSILSAGLRVQYRATTDNFQFVPSIGVRVSKLKTDAMKVGAVAVEKQDQTLIQVPVALRVSGNTQNLGAGWTAMPSFKIAYVPTFGDEEIAIRNAKLEVIDTNPVQGEMGLRFAKDNMMVNVNMTVGGGDNGTSAVGGKVGFKVLF